LTKKGTGEYEYHLSKELYFENLPSIPGIQFLTKTGKKSRKYISGFKITVKAVTKNEAEKLAEKKSKNITNIMCASCVKYSEAYYSTGRFSEYGSITGQITTRIRLLSGILTPINFHNKSFNKLETDTEFEQQIARMHSALKGFNSNNPEAVIRELFNVIGHQIPSGLKKYSSLRHVLSHTAASKQNIAKVEKNFGKNYFEFTAKRTFDYNSQKNMDNLRTAAYEFYDGVKRHLLET